MIESVMRAEQELQVRCDRRKINKIDIRATVLDQRLGRPCRIVIISKVGFDPNL